MKGYATLNLFPFEGFLGGKSHHHPSSVNLFSSKVSRVPWFSQWSGTLDLSQANHQMWNPTPSILSFLSWSFQTCFVEDPSFIFPKQSAADFGLASSGVNFVSSLSQFICLQAFLAEVVVSGLSTIFVFCFVFSILYYCSWWAGIHSFVSRIPVSLLVLFIRNDAFGSWSFIRMTWASPVVKHPMEQPSPLFN